MMQLLELCCGHWLTVLTFKNSANICNPLVAGWKGHQLRQDKKQKVLILSPRHLSRLIVIVQPELVHRTICWPEQHVMQVQPYFQAAGKKAVQQTKADEGLWPRAAWFLRGIGRWLNSGPPCAIVVSK